jgi:DNA-binding PadR family transcriptional regulator
MKQHGGRHPNLLQINQSDRRDHAAGWLLIRPNLAMPRLPAATTQFGNSAKYISFVIYKKVDIMDIDHHQKDELPIIHKRLVGEMFSVFLLWLISKGKTHGYELIKKLNGEHYRYTIGPAHVYPILKLLLKKKWIKQCTEKIGLRIRKCYVIAPDGKEKLLHMKKIFFGGGLRKQFFKEMIS